MGLVSLPQAACMRFEEVLLRNSARVPEQSRFLGDFLVSRPPPRSRTPLQVSFLTVDDE